jgi:hypothetical protein
MNHALWKATGARVLALTFVIAGAVACDRGDNGKNDVRQPAAASPSAVVVGTAPANPAGETAQTTVVAPEGRGEVSKAADNTKRPIEGDNHSYSTVAPTTPQKSDGVNHNGDGGENAKGKQ